MDAGARLRTARAWAAWLAALAALTGAMAAVRPHLDKAHVALAYLLVVLAASARGSRARGLALALAAFLCFNAFFLPPYGTLAVRDPLDWLVLLTFLVVSAVAAHLLSRARSEAEEAKRRAGEMDRLSTLGAETLNAARAQDALRAVAEVIRATLEMDACEIWLAGGEGEPVQAGARALRPGAEEEDGEEAARLAAWRGEVVLERGDGTMHLKPGAAGVPVAEGARALALPLRVRGRTVGVLRITRAAGIRMDGPGRRFFSALSYYAALGAERVRLAGEAEHAQALREADRLKDALLASVSHDLRTPLTTIKALAHDVARDGDDRAVTIEEEADRLNRFVADLLDLSRLSAGALPLSVEIVAAEDLLGAALQRVSGSAAGREFNVALDPSEPLLLGRMDFVQALRVLANLLENAHKYAPPGTPVELSAAREGGLLVFRVGDRGPGVPEHERESIFQPFYRSGTTAPDSGGAGLGLSIARQMAEAQGGSLAHEPRTGGGSVFVFSVPAADLADVIPHPTRSDRTQEPVPGDSGQLPGEGDASCGASRSSL